MRIAVIGTGYVGLVSGACFSEFGVSVTCVDMDSAKIARLRRGEMPIYEPGLESLVTANMAAGRLSFTNELPPALELVVQIGELLGLSGVDLGYEEALELPGALRIER